MRNMAVTLTRTWNIEKPYDSGLIFCFVWEASDGRCGRSHYMSVYGAERIPEAEVMAEKNRMIAMRVEQIEKDLNRFEDYGKPPGHRTAA